VVRTLPAAIKTLTFDSLQCGFGFSIGVNINQVGLIWQVG
jgi:hypothetical protein